MWGWFSRKPLQDAPAPAAADKSSKPLRIPPGVAALARKKPARSESIDQGKVFALPSHPPSVGPSGEKPLMAMDTNIAGAQTWANGYALGGFWTEGITFLGYAYLSELAQRPEYRVISETIATEMTRKWVKFTSRGGDDKAEKIAELEAEMKRLHVRDMFCRAAQQDGFFGRGHIYIDTGDTDDPNELATTIGDGWDDASKGKIKKGGIKSLRTVEAVWCYPTAYNSNNPLKDNWYRPDTWYVQASLVHSSRLLTFIGHEVSDLLKPTYSFGGLSMSQMAKPYVDNWLKTRQSVNDIISGFSIFALMTNLSESLQGDGQQLFDRADLFNNLRDNRGLMMLDKESEDFKNIAAPLGSLDKLQAQAQEHMAAVARIPLVKLLGVTPSGLNASSDGEIRSFYDYIRAYQEHLFRDKLHRLMGLVMLSLWGEVDDGIDFEFESLWALDEKGEAEVRKIEAETGQILIDDGTISSEEERKRVASDPGSGYETIDVLNIPDLEEEEEEGLVVRGHD
jgi:phage-related protein (TIGR01555 family)